MVSILRFTITPATAIVCFRWVMFTVVVLYFKYNSTFWLDDVRVTSSLLSEVKQASPLLLSSNKRVGSFCWNRGSKHGFLTSFSYFSCYFLILGFLRSCYLLVSWCLSWLHRNQIPFSHFLIPWALRGSVLYMHPHVFWNRSRCFSLSKYHVGPW